MTKVRQGNAEVEKKDMDIIYIRNKQTDNYIKYDIADFLHLCSVIDTIKFRNRTELKELHREYVERLDDFVGECDSNENP